MDLGLQGKVALVAASSSGLGLAAALQLAHEGARVSLCGRSQERIEAAVAHIRQETGGKTAVFGAEADVTDGDQIQQWVEATAAQLGNPDILITNAGGPATGTFDSVSLDEWESSINLTLMSVARLVKAALPYLRQSETASILTITSISTKQPITGLIMSNVLRPAVVGLTKTLSQELGPENIRVNSILPSWTSTERVNYLLDYRAQQNNSSREAERTRIANSIPLGRMATPEEFAKAATFLVSPAASFITGTMLQVDGGSYAGLL